jgi:hypothetical protein
MIPTNLNVTVPTFNNLLEITDSSSESDKLTRLKQETENQLKMQQFVTNLNTQASTITSLLGVENGLLSKISGNIRI